MRIWNSRDFYAGLILIFFGVLAMLVARNYTMGTTAQMGPGYVPYVLGAILTFLGFIISIRTLWSRGEPIGHWALRPLILVIGAMIAFGVAILLFFQSAANIAVNLNLIPVSGLPLPFISYGGSGLMALMIGVGLVESVVMRHKQLDF